MTPELLDKLRSFVGLRHLTEFSRQGRITLDGITYRFGRSIRSQRGYYQLSRPPLDDEWDHHCSEELVGISEMTDEEITAFDDVFVLTTLDRIVMLHMLNGVPGFLYGIDEASGGVVVEIGEFYRHPPHRSLGLKRSTLYMFCHYSSPRYPKYLHGPDEATTL